MTNNIIKLVHHDDEKQKYQSHEIYFKIKDFYNFEYEVFSYDISDIKGYGETKEEALEDFKKKVRYLLNQYKELEKLLFEQNELTDNITEVDCFGKEKNT